jgi:serine/threonine protein kinase
VMDYVDGHNLKHAILTSGAFPVRTAVDVIQQAAGAVNAAAEQNIVHRDIKPQNLLLSVENVVKLTDFGLARSHESRDITVTGFFVGTPFYVAPEQVENSRRADTRADLYSLGCVFFETLTGRVPYDGEHAWDVVMQHINAPIPSPGQLRPELGPEFDAFFRRALAKDPTKRFQTPQEFMQALDALPVAPVAAPAGQSMSGAGLFLSATSGQKLPLTAPDMVIGRSDPLRGHKPDIDLLPLDPSQTVSRRHARLSQREGRIYIEDLNAYNRTRVNGTMLVPHQEIEVHPGDTIRLGNVELRLEARAR